MFAHTTRPSVGQLIIHTPTRAIVASTPHGRWPSAPAGPTLAVHRATLPPPPPTEQVRAAQRDIDRSVRDLEREATRLKREEAKIVADVKKAARSGDAAGAKALAKEVVRLRAQKVGKRGGGGCLWGAGVRRGRARPSPGAGRARATPRREGAADPRPLSPPPCIPHQTRLQSSMAQLRGTRASISTTAATAAVGASMAVATKAMQGSVANADKARATILQFQKEHAKADMASEARVGGGGRWGWLGAALGRREGGRAEGCLARHACRTPSPPLTPPIPIPTCMRR